jgi:hypothetical protein
MAIGAVFTAGHHIFGPTPKVALAKTKMTCPRVGVKKTEWK